MLKKREVEIEDDKKTLNKIQPKKMSFLLKGDSSFFRHIFNVKEASKI
jgi:hypothetical protein